MKYIYLTALLLTLLIACKKHQIKPEENKFFSPREFEQKVFDIGLNTDFTDTCAFLFECDCCSGNLVLGKNNDFFLINYCLGDKDLMNGQYNFKKDTLILQYSGNWISREYNWEREMDSTVTAYLMKDTIVPAFERKFLITKCNAKLRFTEIGGEEMAIETSRNYASFIDTLKAIGIPDKFLSLKKPPIK